MPMLMYLVPIVTQQNRSAGKAKTSSFTHLAYVGKRINYHYCVFDKLLHFTGDFTDFDSIVAVTERCSEQTCMSCRL